MKQIQFFLISYKHDVRVIGHNGKSWLIAKDVAEILGYEKLSKMYVGLDGDERSNTTLQIGASWQSVVKINESGLYNAVLGSKKPEA